MNRGRPLGLRRRLDLGLRLVGAIVGGYALSAQLAALTGASLAAVGLPASEATTVALLAAYPIYAGVLLWAWWEPSHVRLWAVVAGGALAATWAAGSLA